MTANPWFESTTHNEINWNEEDMSADLEDDNFDPYPPRQLGDAALLAVGLGIILGALVFVALSFIY